MNLGMIITTILQIDRGDLNVTFSVTSKLSHEQLNVWKNTIGSFSMTGNYWNLGQYEINTLIECFLWDEQIGSKGRNNLAS